MRESRDLSCSSVKEELHHDFTCTERLLKLFEQFYHTSDTELRHRLIRDILDTVYEVIDPKYDKMIRADALIISSTFDDHREQLTFIITCLDHCHQLEELSDDFIKWMISRFIRSRMSIVVNAKIGGFLQEKILHLAGLIADKDGFLHHVVNQLGALVSNQTTFCLGKTTGKYDTQIVLNDINDCLNTVYLSLLDIISHVKFSFESLSCRSLQILWVSLIKICAVGPPRLKSTCVLLFQRLLSLDLGNDIVCRLVFDVIMATEQFVQQEKGSAEGLDILLQAHESCLKVLMELLEDLEHKKSFNGIDVSVVLSWAIRAAELGFSYTSTPVRFEIVTTSIARLLSRLNGDFSEMQLALINKLADLVQKLVERLLSPEPVNSNGIVDHLQAYCSFLLNVDLVSSQNARANWIISYCESRWQSLLRAGKHGDAMKIRRITTAALALCNGRNASAVFMNILPTEQQLIQVLEAASSLGPDASGVFLTVLEIVGDLVSHHTKFPSTASVAFLSLPWLMDPELQLQSKRHMTSLPLLKEMNRLAKTSAVSASDDVLEYTLSALSSVHGFCDWRRTILLAAMSSQRPVLVQAALSHLSMFVSSLDAGSLHRLLNPAIELASHSGFAYSNVDVSCVLNALSHSLCASHPASEVHGASGVTCKACEQLVSGTAVPDQEKVQQLPGLFELLIQVLTDSRYQTEKHIRLDAAALVLTALCHMQCPPDVYLRVVKASLSFINDQDEDVRNVFQSAFKVIVSGTLPSELAEAIFAEFSAGYPAEFEQTMVEASNPFLVVATRNSSCPDLSNRCLHQLFIRALRLLDSTSVFNDCKRTIQELTAKEFSDSRDTRRFFARRKRAFCTDLVNEMLYSWREEDGGDEVINDGIDDLLQVARKVFGFDNVPSFIRASVYIVPYILLSDVEQRPIAVKVLERLRFHMSKHRQDLISEYFPSLLERPLEPAKRKSLKTFIKEYCDLDLRYLFHTKRFLCIVYVLRSIALDEQGYLEILQSMRSNSSREPFSLTAVMKFNCEYLGFLLSFRRSLLDDDHYEQRSVLLPSLATIIRLIDEKFLEDTSNKVMVVLRAATTLGESSVAVWNEFVRRLSDGMLATLLPKILIAIQPLLKYSDTNDLLDNIFARRKPLEIEQSEAFERTAMVLVNSEAGDSSRINFHLRRTCTDNSIENIVSGCVRMLLEECDTVGRVVLQKLLSVLDGNPLTDALAATLVSSHLVTRSRLCFILCVTAAMLVFECCPLSALVDLAQWILGVLDLPVALQLQARKNSSLLMMSRSSTSISLNVLGESIRTYSMLTYSIRWNMPFSRYCQSLSVNQTSLELWNVRAWRFRAEELRRYGIPLPNSSLHVDDDVVVEWSMNVRHSSSLNSRDTSMSFVMVCMWSIVLNPLRNPACWHGCPSPSDRVQDDSSEQLIDYVHQADRAIVANVV